MIHSVTRYLILAGALLLASLSLPAQDYGTGAISTASGDDLYKTVNPNLTNTFVGNFSGMNVYQGTGELGSNNGKWMIRGIGSYGMGSWSLAKFFVDGFEVNAEYVCAISPSEIEKVEVLKDAAALALYGEKGANGIIRITTRRGVEGKTSVQARVRYGIQAPQSMNKPLGSFEYASLYNQAVSNDNGMRWTPVYSEEQLAAYRDGTGIDVDWYDKAMRDYGTFSDVDVILNGGTRGARYNINLDYVGNQGLLSAKNSDSTKNLGYNRFNVRANLDFSVLKIFEVRFDMGGRIEMLHRPNYAISSLFSNLQKYPSNIYNVYDDEACENYSGTAVYPNNPYASVHGLGWYSYKGRSLQTNLSVRENLDMVTPGLYMEEAVSLYSYTLSTYSKTANYARWHNGSTTTTDQTTTLTASGYGSAGMQDRKQGRITAGYDHAFGKHHLTTALNFYLSAFKGDGYFSYKYNVANLNGFVNYVYDDRYVVEAAFSEFGNDAYAPGHRWAFYPTVSAAWVVSNEEFMKGSAFDWLKVRASAGLSGYSDSAATSVLADYSSKGRYLFKDYYTYSYIGSFYTGATSGTWQTTLVPMFVPNKNVHSEKSLKYNLGVDARIGGLSASIDAFLDKRSDILTLDKSLMGYYGKQYSFSNSGKMTNAGFEVELGYSGKTGDFAYGIDGMLSFARNRVDFMDEVPAAHAYNEATGRPFGTYIGLVADGFYDITDFDDSGNLVPTLPTPAFGAVQPGDIKYLDLDKNGIVDQNDVTRIGRSWVPEWGFAMNFRFGWKGFDFQCMMQGVAGVSANLLSNWNQNVAFVDNGNAYEIARGAWAYYPAEGIDNRAGATYPRLTTRSNENNYRDSSFWIKDASFLKCRNLELGYSFDAEKLQKAHISGLRCFVSAQNVFTISPFQRDYNLDPENLSGLYPAIKSFNAGVSITF
ncbi:MAG: SusC/RagA family TonB-linked outer membrane protein [Bacteroidota bacterium]|nr:SusC/RagA family TonB-linked outer membrane protein [Bacteroidota bacterium]